MKKKLIEVSLPLAEINAESSREKSIRHGHPSTLHLWWARRPLAAARAVLWASLVDDPSSHPEKFPDVKSQQAERDRLHRLLTELVKWENSSNEEILAKARAEIEKSMGEDRLVFLDPFAGGGSIPLEAQRLGLEAHAHDLNPVAVMINKAMLEIPPRFAGRAPVNPQEKENLGKTWKGAAGLASDVAFYGQWLKEEAFKKIGHLYPKVKLEDGSYATVIAWIWARTVKCPNPACGCEMPLASSFVLSKKKGNEAWIEPVINGREISFHIKSGKCPEGKETGKLGKGAIFKCPACGSVTDRNFVREEFKSGRTDTALLAIVAEGKNKRIYLSPDKAHFEAAKVAIPEDYPTGELFGKARADVSIYGMNCFHELFTPRQLTALTTFSDLIQAAQKKAEADAIAAGMAADGIGLADGGSGAKAYGEAIGVYLAFGIDRMAMSGNSLVRWNNTAQKAQHCFGRQALPMLWDFAEVNFFASATGSADAAFFYSSDPIVYLPESIYLGTAQQKSGQQNNSSLNNLIVSTDPPYYDNIGYADLSDFFYIWLRQSLCNTYPDIFRTMLVPKEEELVATPYRFGGDRKKAREFFENGMKDVFSKIRSSARADVPLTIYYAFKQSEADSENGDNIASTGWETMLEALLQNGFNITGTWPIRTEMRTRQVAMDTNALASSIVLVCRKRPSDAPQATRRQFLAELRKTLPQSLATMRQASIAPVDLAQAAIGPGMEIYSRYSGVLDASGSPMTVRQALQAINAALDACLSEGDASLDEASRFCVDLYSQSAFNAIAFGAADVLARAKNTSVERLVELGVVEAQKGNARLLGHDELPEKPRKAEHLGQCLWLLTQYMARETAKNGINGLARILAEYPDDRARDLAYRLHGIAERKGWSGEAYAYNALVTAWPDAMSKARAGFGPMQGELQE